MSKANKKWVLGADPGKAGAIVLINAAKTAGTFTQEDIVCIPTKVKDGKVDVVNFFDKLQPYAKDIILMVQEHVHAIFGSSAKGSFEFGDANGSLKATLQLCGHLAGTDLPVHIVLPKKWQETAWKHTSIVGAPIIDPSTGNPQLLKNGAIKIKIDTKATSLSAARSVFPGVSFVQPRCKKEHDGCVDAALIAYYGLKNLYKKKCVTSKKVS